MVLDSVQGTESVPDSKSFTDVSDCASSNAEQLDQDPSDTTQSEYNICYSCFINLSNLKS